MGNMQMNGCGFMPIELFFLYKNAAGGPIPPMGSSLPILTLGCYPMLGLILGKDLPPPRYHPLPFIFFQIPLESCRPLCLFPTRCYLDVP